MKILLGDFSADVRSEDISNRQPEMRADRDFVTILALK
jgi:hypothetical protein